MLRPKKKKHIWQANAPNQITLHTLSITHTHLSLSQTRAQARVSNELPVLLLIKHTKRLKNSPGSPGPEALLFSCVSWTQSQVGVRDLFTQRSDLGGKSIASTGRPRSLRSRRGAQAQNNFMTKVRPNLLPNALQNVLPLKPDVSPQQIHQENTPKNHKTFPVNTRQVRNISLLLLLLLNMGQKSIMQNQYFAFFNYLGHCLLWTDLHIIFSSMMEKQKSGSQHSAVKTEGNRLEALHSYSSGIDTCDIILLRGKHGQSDSPAGKIRFQLSVYKRAT